MKKIIDFLFSGLFMGMLLIIFATACGYATFIESDYSADAAQILIYHTKWFEIVILLMALNFCGMIFTKKLYRKGKRNIMMIHISWIVIILGAGITRYFGFEGNMHIRDGQTTNQFLSSETYVTAQITDQNKKYYIHDHVLLAPLEKTLYDRSLNINGDKTNLSIVQYLPHATMKLKQVHDGEPVIDLISAGLSGRDDIILESNETNQANGINFSFNDSTFDGSIKFRQDNEGLQMNSPYPIREVDMAKKDTTEIESGIYVPVKEMKIYSVNNVLFVIRHFMKNAVIEYSPSKDESNSESNIVYVSFKVGGQQRVVPVKWQRPKIFTVNDVKINISIGPRVRQLPFSLTLNKFELDRYPGSKSPSSFSSDIMLNDSSENIHEPYKIFMNNVLNYKGFRFYQSSYDRDEKGTILSVNHDKWGTIITYLGYLILFITMIYSLFTPGTRFPKLTHLINEIHLERKKIALVLAGLMLSFFSWNRAFAQDINPSIIVDKDHAASFGKLLTQSSDGRIIPLNTVANNVLVKIYKKDHFMGLTADQVFLSMGMFTSDWKKIPIIKVSDNSLKTRLRIKGDYAAFYNFYDNHGNYKLQNEVNLIYQKSPATRTAYEKEIMAVDERLNVCELAFNGDFVKIYPVPQSITNQWVGASSITPYLKWEDTLFAKGNFIQYVKSVREGVQTHDYSKANEILSTIKELQREYGAAVRPSDFKINLEIFYNKYNIFKSLFPVYMMLGMILLGIFFMQVFKPAFELKKFSGILYILVLICFSIHSIGLLMRWIISEHAPWSNGYESMIYIAWAIILAGIIFRKKSIITLAITSILAGITLLTAHMSWLNPEITNLVPVLKSYWLTIHVATITASYGFLALGSMLGFLNLILMIFRTKNNIKHLGLTITEINCIIEMTLTVGLILLTIGTFLGGIWANESWGRYWGWDPKETWSLVTIIVYSFILHMNLIPGLKSKFTLNFFALIGFGTVLMTYFGVNYFLSGLHSYAQGESVNVPGFVYYVLGIVFVISLVGAISDIRFKEEDKDPLKEPIDGKEPIQ